MNFKTFVDNDPVMDSIQKRAARDGLEADTKMHYGDLLTVMHAACRRAFEAGAGRFRPLFEHNDRLNPDGEMLSSEISRVIDPICRGFVRDGFSPREVSHVAAMCVFEVELEGVLNLPHQAGPFGKSLASTEPTESAEKIPEPSDGASKRNLFGTSYP